MPKNTNNANSMSAYVVYFRRDGEKKAVLKNSLKEVNDFKDDLYFHKRKFLGYRPVKVMLTPAS